MFTGRRLGGTSAIDWPPMNRTSPESGARKPAIMRSSVVLPQPEGPRIEKKAAALDGERQVVNGHQPGVALGDTPGFEVWLMHPGWTRPA
jgi:hypothetical protein